MPTAFFVLALTVLGFVLGGFFGGRVFVRGSGLDAMIQALGGVMIGTVVAFVAGIALVRWLSRRVRVAGGALALAAAAALLIGMQLVPPTPTPVTSAPSEPAEPPFDPPFAVTLLAGDGSASSSAAGSGLAWKTLTARSLDSGWTVVRWQDPSKTCHASLDRASLERIAQALQAIPAEAACEPCAACDRQSLVWSVGRGGGGDRPIDSRCLASRLEFAALIDALREVERRVSANEQCAAIAPAGP